MCIILICTVMKFEKFFFFPNRITVDTELQDGSVDEDPIPIVWKLFINCKEPDG